MMWSNVRNTGDCLLPKLDFTPWDRFLDVLAGHPLDPNGGINDAVALLAGSLFGRINELFRLLQKPCVVICDNKIEICCRMAVLEPTQQRNLIALFTLESYRLPANSMGSLLELYVQDLRKTGGRRRDKAMSVLLRGLIRRLPSAYRADLERQNTPLQKSDLQNTIKENKQTGPSFFSIEPPRKRHASELQVINGTMKNTEEKQERRLENRVVIDMTKSQQSQDAKTAPIKKSEKSDKSKKSKKEKAKKDRKKKKKSTDVPEIGVTTTGITNKAKHFAGKESENSSEQEKSHTKASKKDKMVSKLKPSKQSEEEAQSMQKRTACALVESTAQDNINKPGTEKCCQQVSPALPDRVSELQKIILSVKIDSSLLHAVAAVVARRKTMAASTSTQLLPAGLRELHAKLYVLGQSAPNVLEEICRLLDMGTFTDEQISVFMSMFLTKDTGFRACCIILETCLVPSLRLLVRPTSRVLYSVMVDSSKLHPRAILQGIMIPLLVSSPSIGSPQCEVLNRLMKECLSMELRVEWLRSLTDAALRVLQKGKTWFEWQMKLQTGLLNMRLPLVKSDSTHHELAADLVQSWEAALNGAPGEEGSVKYCKSLTFTTMVFTFMSKYTALAIPFVNILRGIVTQFQTFIKRPAVQLVDKMQKGN